MIGNTIIYRRLNKVSDEWRQLPEISSAAKKKTDTWSKVNDNNKNVIGVRINKYILKNGFSSPTTTQGKKKD